MWVSSEDRRGTTQILKPFLSGSPGQGASFCPRLVWKGGRLWFRRPACGGMKGTRHTPRGQKGRKTQGRTRAGGVNLTSPNPQFHPPGNHHWPQEPGLLPAPRPVSDEPVRGRWGGFCPPWASTGQCPACARGPGQSTEEGRGDKDTSVATPAMPMSLMRGRSPETAPLPRKMLRPE